MGARFAELSSTISVLAQGSPKDIESGLHRELSWCYKDGCEQCLNYSKRLQVVSNEMQNISAHYSALDTKTLASFVDSGKEWRNNLGLYRAVIQVNQGKFQSLISSRGDEICRSG
jgi:hypothetical protein